MSDAKSQHPLQIGIVPSPREELPLAVHSNHVMTSNTETEVMLDLAQVNPPLVEAEVADLGETLCYRSAPWLASRSLMCR